eukprot:TRINITY_DN1861_c2_g1_i1.p1 TRINITY_DN1861_c2_g1~~TRINITY_DN1861_c2_g1_i1.p1  ORF type:complete len:479 (-),score=30.98 TRINITY_DN1861_c2_g1_i1:167-1603(-)
MLHKLSQPSVSCWPYAFNKRNRYTISRADRKVSLVNLGCPKNVVDGEVMLGDLQRHGYEAVESHEESDAIIVNTCTFINEAKTEAIEEILKASQLKNRKDGKKLIVTGCMAQRYGKEMAEELKEIDMIVGFENYKSLGNILNEAFDANSTNQVDTVAVGSPNVPFRPEGERKRLTPLHYAYLRVAEGCNHKCTFCAIPSFRGKFRSKPWQWLLDEAKQLVEQGVVELNLIAEDTNQYGQDRRDNKNLATLLRELSKLEGLQWIRILYAYPSYFDDTLIEEIANNPKVCKYIDMPLQHINNTVLLSMNRPTQQHTINLLENLRKRIPDLFIRTTFICGFPGETQQHHQELLEFCRKFRFERMGCFVYSLEDNTPAANIPNQVPYYLCQERRDELFSLQQAIQQQVAESLVGKELDILIDSQDDHGSFVGRTQWDCPEVDPIVFVTLPQETDIPELKIGQMRRCRIYSTSIYDLYASPIE